MISETEHTGCANNDNALGIVKEEHPSNAQKTSVHPALSCKHQDVYTKLVVTCVHPDIAMSVCVWASQPTSTIDQTIIGMPQHFSMFNVSFGVDKPRNIRLHTVGISFGVHRPRNRLHTVGISFGVHRPRNRLHTVGVSFGVHRPRNRPRNL